MTSYTADQVAILTGVHAWGPLVWTGGEDAAIHDIQTGDLTPVNGDAARELLDAGLLEPEDKSDPGKGSWRLSEAGDLAASDVTTAPS